MKIEILTIFPQMFECLRYGVIGKALENDVLRVETVDIRAFSTDKHRKTDDYPFGGGGGMVMTCDPIYNALESIDAQKKKIFYMSPKGRVLDKAAVDRIGHMEEIVILCGHYEGIDQRILDGWDIEEISIGDYILTGGEPAAIVFVDSITRMIPGVLGNALSAEDESVYSGLLEHPQYTKPREYRGMKVPEVLISGDHEKIRQWKFEESLKITKERRQEMFEAFCGDENGKASMKKVDKIIMDNVKRLV